MSRKITPILFLVGVALCGCQEQINGYTAAASISANGFARSSSQLESLNSKEILIWGYVDHHNLYGDDSARKVLGAWWSGEGPAPTSWQFNLQARENDAAGRSFAVIVPNGPERDALLSVFRDDAIANRSTRVFVKGRIFTYKAPANFGSRVGLYMKLQSSGDILFEPPERNRQTGP